MGPWPFEGRAGELAAVRAAFTGSAVNALVILAPAGVGKTRLAREALSGLGCRTEWVAATAAAGKIPFGALAHLLPEAGPSSTDQAGLVRALCDRVARAGGRRRLAIGVDDADLLDGASSTVVANAVAAGTAFAVLTARTGRPLADGLARLVRDGVAEVLELAPLPDPVIDRLIDHGTGGAVEAAERRRLRLIARGNPLALRELLHGALPGGLTDLVASRLDALEPATRQAVEIVACGEPVPLPFLERLAGPSAVADAESSGLVVGEPAGLRVQARLDHPLSGEILRARMPVARSRQIYRDLAAELIGTPTRRREDVLLAAVWQVEGGRIVRPDLVREGARQAVGRAGLALAERLARAARDAEPGPQADWLLAEILEYQGRSDEAAGLLPADPPQGCGEPVRWAVARADWLYWASGNLAGAMRALDTSAGHPTIEGGRAFILFFAGRFAEAVRAAGVALDRAEVDPQGFVWSAAAATASLGFLDRVEPAREVRTRGLAVAAAHQANLPWGAFQIEIGACLAHLAAGRPEIAAEIAGDGYRTATRGGAPMMASGWGLYGGIVAAVQGDLDRAEPLLAEALAGFDLADTFRLRRLCLAAQAWVNALRGNGRSARELMTRADRLDNGTNQVFAPWIETWRGWVAYACGDAAAAAAHAVRAAELATAAGMPVVAALARYEAVRLGGGVTGAAATAAEAARIATVPGDLPAALAAAARALAAAGGADGTDGAALDRAADALDRHGYPLHAAELATAAARAARRAGHRGRAGLATAKAAMLRGRCPGALTPLLTHEDLRGVLTAREHQVALLAGRHTSRQIAERLGLALATVNNTLARAYVKLGVTSREELRALLDLGDATAIGAVAPPGAGDRPGPR